MKTIVQIFSFFLLVLFTSSGAAQDCSTYFPSQEGTILKYENYNKKGKSEGVVTHTLEEINSNGEGTTVLMHSSMVDEKGKNTFETDFEVECTAEGYSIRLTDFLMPSMTEQLQQMEMEMELSGDNLFIPNKLKEGMELPNASMVIKPNMGGMSIMTIRYETTDRKVISRESLTTAAGTFDCYVLQSTLNVKTMGNRTFTSKEWLSEGVGVVRSETFDKNGKIMSSMELIAKE